MFEMKENEHHVETLKELKPLYEELVGSDFDDEEGFSQEQLNNLKNQLSDTLSAMDITDDDYFLYKRALNAVTYLAEDDNFNKIAQTSVIEDKDTTHITEAELATIAAAGSDEQTILSDKDLAVAKDFDKYLEVLPQYAPTIDILKEIYEEAGLDEITNMSEHVLGVINHNNRVLGISIGSKYLSNPESIRVAKYKEKLKAFAEEQTGDKKAAAEFLNKYISFISNAFGNKSKLELNDFELADQAGFGDPDLISGVNESDGRLSLNDIAALGDDYSIFNNENDLDSVTRKKVLNNSRYKNLLTDGVITMDELIKMINTKLDGNYNKNNDTAKFILDFFHVIASLDGDESTISQSDLEEMFNISGGDTVNIGALMAKYLETARKKQTEELDELIG